MRGSLALALVMLAAACASATGDVSGGDPRIDAGAADAGFPEELVDAGSGSTWTDLYRDLFGPTGIASCAGSGDCHGSATQTGAKQSGFVCADQPSCRQKMLDSSLVKASNASAPDKSILVQTIRHRADSGAIIGFMPKNPPTVFPRAAMDRVRAWIAAGAPDN